MWPLCGPLRRARTGTGAGGANINLKGARDKRGASSKNPDLTNLAQSFATLRDKSDKAKLFFKKETRRAGKAGGLV